MNDKGKKQTRPAGKILDFSSPLLGLASPVPSVKLFNLAHLLYYVAGGCCLSVLGLEAWSYTTKNGPDRYEIWKQGPTPRKTDHIGMRSGNKVLPPRPRIQTGVTPSTPKAISSRGDLQNLSYFSMPVSNAKKDAAERNMIESVFCAPEVTVCHPDHRYHAPLGRPSSPRDGDREWNNEKE